MSGNGPPRSPEGFNPQQAEARPIADGQPAPAAPGDPLAALSEEIRRAARRVRRVRRVGLGVVALWLLLAAFAGGEEQHEALTLIAASQAPVWRLLWVLGLIAAVFGGMILLMVGGLALAPAAVYRQRKRKRLRGTLAALPPAEAAAILLPLRDERGDTGRLVRGLLRDLDIPTDSTPAPDGPEPDAEPRAPDGRASTRRRRFQVAALILAAVTAYPGLMVWRWHSTWTRAKHLYEARRIAEATPALERYVALYPEDPEGHYWLGNALGLTRQVDRAIPELRRAAELDPRNAEYQSGLGNALGLAKQHAEAIHAYRSAVALKPGDPSFRVAIGFLELQQGNLGAARQEFQRALQIDPNCEDARQFLRLIQRRGARSPGDDRPRERPPTWPEGPRGVEPWPQSDTTPAPLD